LAFVLVDKYYIAFVNKKRIHTNFNRILTRVKFLSWFIWFAISVYFLLLNSTVITLIFLIGIYLLTKDSWKNIYAGLFFINKLKEGDYIYISKLEMGGIINRLLFSDIELLHTNKGLIYVPYSLLTNSPVIRKERSGNHFLNEFVVDTQELNTSLDERLLKQIITNCPWTINSKPIEIDFMDDGKINIGVYTFSRDTAANQREFVLSQLKNI